MRGWAMGLGASAGLMGASGVALAAVGAHRSGNPNVTIAATFLLLHAVAITALCAISLAKPSRGILTATSLLALGTILFSGELALHALSGVTFVPIAAPTGGILMIIGWLVVAVALPVTLGSF